uniref:Uncharacterized protein n=1 Tax=Schizophyllum commune (strain H4-8 / FGSC 9210) TaxID=578458 RepID=D8Q2D3_SCHCM
MADTDQSVHALAVERTKRLSDDHEPATEAHPLAGTALYTGWRESLLGLRDYQLATSRANNDLSRRLEQVRQEIHLKDQAIAELRRKIPPSDPRSKILATATAQISNSLARLNQRILERKEEPSVARLTVTNFERENEVGLILARVGSSLIPSTVQLMRRKLPTLDRRQASGLESSSSSSQKLIRLPTTTEDQVAALEVAKLEVLLQADLNDRRNRESSWVAELSLLRDQVRELSDAEHIAAGHRMAEVYRASQGLEASKCSCSYLALQQSLSTVRTSVDGQRGRTYELKRVVSALVQKQELLRQTVDLKALHNENVAADQRLSIIQAQYGALQSQIAQVEAEARIKVYQLEKDRAWSKEQMNDLRGTYVKDVGSLQEQVDDLHAQIDVIKAKVESAQSRLVATDGSREESQMDTAHDGEQASILGGGHEDSCIYGAAAYASETRLRKSSEHGQSACSGAETLPDKEDDTAMDVDDQGLDLEEHEAPRPSHGAAECPTNLVCSSSIIPGSLRSLTENDKGSVAGTPKGRVASGTPGRRVAAGLNMPKQKLRGVDVADHLTALDQFKLGSPLRTPSPRKRGPRSAKGAHDGQHTPRSRHSPYSREARPSRYGRVGDMGEDCDADDEEVPRRNRERPRSHPTRSRPLRRAKFEDVNDMDDDYDYDDYNDYDDDGNDVEPKTPVSRIARRFLQEKIAPGALYAPQTMKKNFNNLVLGLILRGMGIQLVYHVVALEPVSDEELDAFRRNPRSHGPDLEDLRLDTNGLATTDELSGSAWNQRVAKLLCGKVKEITDRDGGDGRFGVVDADRIKRGVDTRLGRMYRLIASVVPQAGEDVVDAIARFREAHQAYNDQRRVTTSRQTKALARLRYAGVLRTACRVSNKPEALAYWSYVMRAVEALGFEGMSDEETDYEEIEHDSGVVTKRRYHKVLNPVWRRPELRDLFAKVDEAPALARMYFDKRAGAKTPRVRVDEASGQAPPKRIPKALYDPVWLEAQGELVELMLELTDDPFEIFQADAWAEESHMRYPSALNTALSKCRWSKPEEKEGAQSNNGDRTGLTGHLQGTIESSYDLAVLPNRIWRMVDCCLLESEPGVVLVGVSPWTHSPSPQVNCRTAVQDRRPQLGKLENAKDLEEAGRAGLSLRPISLNDSIEDRRQGQEQVHPHLVETGRRTEELAKSIFVEKSDTTFGDERDEDEKPWELKEPVGLLADYLCGEDVFGDAPAPSLRTTSATLRSMSTHAKDKDPSRLGPRSSLIKELLHRVEAFGAWPDHEEEELHLQPHPQRARSLRDEYIEVLTPRFSSKSTTAAAPNPYATSSCLE